MDLARKHLAEQLAPLLPEKWVLIDHYGTEDEVEPGTVRGELILTSITKNPENPLGSHLVAITFVLTIPQVDPETREDHLDSNLDDFLYALRGLGAQGIRWTTANRTVSGNQQHVGWNVEIEVITAIETPEPSTPKE